MAIVIGGDHDARIRDGVAYVGLWLRFQLTEARLAGLRPESESSSEGQL